MAGIIRSAKPGSDWEDNESELYNIHLDFQDAQTFFGENSLPVLSVHEEVLTAATADEAVDNATYRLLAQLDLAMMPTDPEETAVVDFAVALFESLGYLDRPRAVRTRKELRFTTCSERKYAKPDICIIDRSANDIILLAQEDYGGDINPHAQLIAEAIAAFQNNNARRRLMGLASRESQVCLGSMNFSNIMLFILLARVGQARYNHEWDSSEFFQDPCHPGIVAMRQARAISSRPDYYR